jgi:hypothetical protein
MGLLSPHHERIVGEDLEGYGHGTIPVSYLEIMSANDEKSMRSYIFSNFLVDQSLHSLMLLIFFSQKCEQVNKQTVN